MITSVNEYVCFIVLAIRATPKNTNAQKIWQKYAYKEQVVVAACQRILRIQRLPHMNVGRFNFHLCLCTFRIFRNAFARKNGRQILGRILGPPPGQLIVTEQGNVMAPSPREFQNHRRMSTAGRHCEENALAMNDTKAKAAVPNFPSNSLTSCDTCSCVQISTKDSFLLYCHIITREDKPDVAINVPLVAIDQHLIAGNLLPYFFVASNKHSKF